MKNHLLLFTLKLITLSFVVSLVACKSTNPMKNAQDYCLEHDRDQFKNCVRYRKDYLIEKQKVITKFKENTKRCEEYAIYKIGGVSNQCSNNNNDIVKTATASVSGNVNSQQNCDKQSNSANRNNNTSVHQIRMDMQKKDITKECMKDYGWKSDKSYRAELKVLKQKFGYAEL
ncbi:hypothetical protein CJF42_18705 [Pseudoalteromonas sp. NBT06-2]|uniref:hypothetical protein n=1 Tax=Pseudoalteromonas sp. NBT06-2 TaxID=2025950 RepID=UPI000BA62004|nr:hypothetical protein [Pseudoalteromonas sp. NBT06-2]PAJ72923.1 hypothetical protein CJF42_18705 [Pseudoalteromonas sp. NBT06-2]